MSDPLGSIDEDAPPEPVIPLDPELEVCLHSLIYLSQSRCLILENVHSI